MAIAAACGGDAREASGPSIDGAPIHAAVVELVAARDGLDPAAARARVIETMRLVAAARADAGTAPLGDDRRAHLRRGALARTVLHDDFEAHHRVDDIPKDHPLLQRARTEPRFVHPQIHLVCQFVLSPPRRLDDADLATASADPTWRAQALARMQDVRRHIEAVVPIGDAGACELMLRTAELERGPDDDASPLRGEGVGGFDLDACAVELAADGTCSEPRFAPEWVDAVRVGPVPGLRGPFATRFGVHLALVREILPARSPELAGFDAELRSAVHPAWATAAIGEWLTTLRSRHAALVASGGE